jgi:phytol kinase
MFVTAYARKTTLQGSALLASALVLYTSWALGGWQWLVPPSILILTYAFCFPGKITESDRTHNVYAVLSIASAGLMWLFLFRIWQQPGLLFPYTLAFAIHLGIIAWNLLYPRYSSVRLVMVAFIGASRYSSLGSWNPKWDGCVIKSKPIRMPDFTLFATRF